MGKSLLVLMILVIGTLLGILIDDTYWKKQLAKDVPLTNIPIKGNVQFVTQVRLMYRDGTLDEATLITGTTKKIE